MLPPTPAEVGVAVGGPGSGPSDLAAAKFLGLTTQVPVTMDMAVPGRAPADVPGIEFRSRPHTRALLGLKPAEVDVLEVAHRARQCCGGRRAHPNCPTAVGKAGGSVCGGTMSRLREHPLALAPWSNEVARATRIHSRMW